MGLQRNPIWPADSLALMSRPWHAKGHILQLKRAGFDLVTFDSDRGIVIPSTVHAVILRPMSTSHHMSDIAFAWARKNDKNLLMYADGMVEALKLLIQHGLLIDTSEIEKTGIAKVANFDPANPSIPQRMHYPTFKAWIFALHDMYRPLTTANVIEIMNVQGVAIDKSTLVRQRYVSSVVSQWRKSRGYDIRRPSGSPLVTGNMPKGGIPANWLPPELEDLRELLESEPGVLPLGFRNYLSQRWTMQDEQRLHATLRLLRHGGLYSRTRLQQVHGTEYRTILSMHNALLRLLNTLYSYRANNKHFTV